MEFLPSPYLPSPTLKAFHASEAFVRGVMGPVGSGKSSAMCVELASRAWKQPRDHAGVRMTRFAVIRNTYPELRSTTIKTWADWFPDTLCPVSGSGPHRAILTADNLADGSSLRSEILFLALDRPRDVKKLLSLEVTGAWINEAREINREILDVLTSRVGRYPPKRKGGPKWSGIIMDTNPPDDDHWWYRLAEENRPDGWEFFRQPPALLESPGGYAVNPRAENLENQPLGADYWLRQARGKSGDWVKVYLLGRYGTVREGRPVYPEYDDSFHLAAEDLKPSPGVDLLLGWDFGLEPACVVVQVHPGGAFLVLEEIIGKEVGIRRFAREVVLPRLNQAYPGFTLRGFADPAGSARAQTNERSCMEELAAAGLGAHPARTNDFIARREAVAGFLNRRPDGHPAFLLSPACRLLRKGFLSGYRLERLQTSGEARFRDRPVKDRFSHVHDALQYAALAAEAGPGCARRRAVRKHPRAADTTAGY
jgi:hypothetical protein